MSWITRHRILLIIFSLNIIGQILSTGGEAKSSANIMSDANDKVLASTPDKFLTRGIWKMLGPFATESRLMPIHQGSLAVLSRATCASMSTTSTTTTTTTTTTTRHRGDCYGPMEWAQWGVNMSVWSQIRLEETSTKQTDTETQVNALPPHNDW